MFTLSTSFLRVTESLRADPLSQPNCVYSLPPPLPPCLFLSAKTSPALSAADGAGDSTRSVSVDKVLWVARARRTRLRQITILRFSSLLLMFCKILIGTFQI